MLPRIRRKAWLALPLMLAACALLSLADPSSAPAPIRYHFGDDPDGHLGWASPNFDDSAWPIAPDGQSQTGQWPLPPVDSDGFIWVRYHIPVREDASGPLAVRSWPPFPAATSNSRFAIEVYAGGLLVGRQGSLPPRVELTIDHRDEVFDLPASAAVPGKTAVVALRAWNTPGSRAAVSSASWRVSVDESRNLRLAHQNDLTGRLYANLLDLALNGLLLVLGVGVLIAWRRLGGRTLLVFAFTMIAHSVTALVMNPSLPGIGALPWGTVWLINAVALLATLASSVEFVWTVFEIRATWLKRLWQGFAVLYISSFVILGLPLSSTAILHWATLTLAPSIVSFGLIETGVSLWVLLVKRRNRFIAFTLAALGSTTLAAIGILPGGWMVGPFYEGITPLAFFLAAVALFLALGQRAWQAWRARDELRVEFDAAREVQERLVAPAADLPGFKIESAYRPAKQVGGDFFRVVPEPDGSVLVVVGDVSGKGLRAAMTVSAIIGALRTMPELPLPRILGALNRGLFGQIGGFVTCCVARIAQDGSATIANAGNLSPYINGTELTLAPSLPLGMAASIYYEEQHFKLEPNQPLTFLSDGVIEARSLSGELFGFTRAQAISTEPAEKVAQAAEAFGQNDDITVLTLTRLPVAEHAIAMQTAPSLAPA